jgi:hypothetical protein
LRFDQKCPVMFLHIKMLDSIASETPIFFKVKWFLGYIFDDIHETILKMIV